MFAWTGFPRKLPYDSFPATKPTVADSAARKIQASRYLTIILADTFLTSTDLTKSREPLASTLMILRGQLVIDWSAATEAVARPCAFATKVHVSTKNDAITIRLALISFLPPSKDGLC